MNNQQRFAGAYLVPAAAAKTKGAKP